MFADEQQFYRSPVRCKEKLPPDDQGRVLERQWDEEVISQKVDTKALKDMTAVLADLTELVRELYRIPTQAEAHKQWVAEQQLKLKQEAATDETQAIHVVLDAGPGEWDK